VLFAAATAVIALDPPGGIVSLTAFSGSLYGACFFPAIVLGLHWRRGSGVAVVTSFVAGVVVLLTWDLLPGSEILHEVFPALLLSSLAYVGISLVTPIGATGEAARLLLGAAPAEEASRA
jgi:Na+/pantothenate symporter